MNRSKLIYYIVFPLVTFSLCGFSFYLGLTRGKTCGETTATEPTPASPAEVHEPGAELTFFKTLHSEEELPKKPAAKPTPGPASAKKAETRGKYAIQLSAFRDIGKAHELIDDLKNKGFLAFTQATSTGGDALHRVLVGPYASKEKAETVASDLASNGFQKGFVTTVERH